uniref:Uncharacterized protein n=1 Tax=Zea mays TaxID=4577 RepID=C0P316_MAIZE|nr:unknown [Zea mays]
MPLVPCHCTFETASLLGPCTNKNHKMCLRTPRVQETCRESHLGQNTNPSMFSVFFLFRFHFKRLVQEPCREPCKTKIRYLEDRIAASRRREQDILQHWMDSHSTSVT